MSDPIAQAAAQIDAAPSSTEPSGIIGELKQVIHKAEDAIEHLIHPEDHAPGKSGSAEAADQSSLAGTSSGAGSTQGDAPAVAQPGESSAMPAESAAASEAPASAAQAGIDSSPAASSEPSAPISPISSTENSASAEHPHTAILRRLTTTLRRKFNVFDGELEALLKDAESHL